MRTPTTLNQGLLHDMPYLLVIRNKFHRDDPETGVHYIRTGLSIPQKLSKRYSIEEENIRESFEKVWWAIGGTG
jgi:hypothetical protein